MLGQIEAVVFDLGGVLIDWNPRHLYRKVFDGDEAAMERFLSEVVTPEWNSAVDAGRPFDAAVAELSARHPDQAELIGYYKTRWPEMVSGPLDATVAILRELKAARLRTFALSNWSAETFPVMRDRFDFLAEFDGVLISGDVSVGKPSPAIFEMAIERFHLVPDRTVFVDDWDRNVVTASDLGLVAVRFFDADQLRHDLRALGLPLAEGAEPVE